MARTLASYSLTELYDLEAQGEALLPTLTGSNVPHMLDLLASLKGEIGDRRGPDNLAASVCGYGENGELLDAAGMHRFARVRGRRG